MADENNKKRIDDKRALGSLQWDGEGAGEAAAQAEQSQPTVPHVGAAEIDEAALNEAAWEFIEHAPRNSIQAELWNNLRAALRPAIALYLSKPDPARPSATEQSTDDLPISRSTYGSLEECEREQARRDAAAIASQSQAAQPTGDLAEVHLLHSDEQDILLMANYHATGEDDGNYSFESGGLLRLIRRAIAQYAHIAGTSQATQQPADNGLTNEQAFADLQKEGARAIEVLRAAEWPMLANRLNSAILELEQRFPHLAHASQATNAQAEPEGWKKLHSSDAIDWRRKLDVVLDNGVYEYDRYHSQIDWTAVRDWRYAAPVAKEAPTKPEGWHVERKPTGTIIVRKDSVGGCAVRADDNDITASVLWALADDILVASVPKEAEKEQQAGQGDWLSYVDPECESAQDKALHLVSGFRAAQAFNDLCRVLGGRWPDAKMLNEAPKAHAFFTALFAPTTQQAAKAESEQAKYTVAEPHAHGATMYELGFQNGQQAHVMPPFAAPAGQPDAGEAATDTLYGAVMNIRCDIEQCSLTGASAEMSYKQGHRDARHAAASLIAEAASGFREGRNTKPESTDSSDAAPTTSTVSAPTGDAA